MAAIIEFLELLAREAAAAEFEGPLDAARAAGMSAEHLAELERAKRVALRVRAVMERRRRREEELSGLFDTAGDLAALRDVDAVLDAIVHRARTLLGADVAYMTLTDEARGDTYMRVTDGSVSARFQALRLPMGAGLGGLVAQTGMPYVTADYPADERFRHTREIDGGVGEEGLIAILGVPMRLGARVIGVLYAANRSARPFAREEVSLLSSLAAHAAVALDSARLLGETRATLDELSAANTRFRAHSESVERAAAAHDRMTALVLRGAGVEDVAAVVTDVLGGALLVLDADGRELATVGALDPDDLGAVDAAVSTARTEGRALTTADGALWVAAVAAGAEHLGALVLRTDHQLVDADQRILERAAVVTALLLLFRRTVADAEGRVRGELLDDLVARSPHDVESVRARAKRLGVDLDAPHVVVVASTPEADADTSTGHPAAGHSGVGHSGAGHSGAGHSAAGHSGAGQLGRSAARVRAGSGQDASGGRPVVTRQRALSWAQSYASARSGLAAVRDGRLVLLLPGEAAGELARAVARDLGRLVGQPVTAGAGGPAADPAELWSAYRDADRCLLALTALGRCGTGASTGEIGFVGLLLSSGPGGRDREVATFLDATIGPAVDYDARRGTTLVQTLETYFGTGGSQARAATALHVHVNTVTQRLDRVGQLLGADWQLPERALEIQLALRLHRLRS